MNIAVITGASSGLGHEFVTQLDADENFDEIWLIARRADRLEALAPALRAKARILPLDLEKPESIEVYRETLEEVKPRIAVLVNAAGFGRFGAFSDISLEDQYGMVDLNVKSLVGMTYVSEPYMEKGSRVYELCSMSSFQPVPYINVYAATKAFVLSFTRALNAEWKKKGIRVMAVSPLWVRTEFFNRARTDDTIRYYNRTYEAKDVVRRALKDMKRGRDVSIEGIYARMQMRGTKILPHSLVMRLWKRQQRFD